MLNEKLIREIARKACSEALQERAREIADVVSQRVEAALAALPAEPVEAPRPTQSPSDCTKQLRDGTELIANSRTQSETLEALLGAASAITADCGLLIVRGTQATGWSCQGLTDSNNFKRAALDCSRGVGAALLSSPRPLHANPSELDPVFMARLGIAPNAGVLLLPILLKSRVVAILLALGCEEDLHALDLLVQVSQLALDLQSYRKALPQTPEAHPAPEPVRAAAAPQRSTVAAATSATAPVPASLPASYGRQVSAQLPASGASPAPAEELHEKACRFARLLVEEIKLYNQAKVTEGRARCDLYSRLKDDIEKSRAAYERRYGSALPGTDYFSRELLRILADNNRALMGGGFPG